MSLWLLFRKDTATRHDGSFVVHAGLVRPLRTSSENEQKAEMSRCFSLPCCGERCAACLWAAVAAAWLQVSAGGCRKSTNRISWAKSKWQLPGPFRTRNPSGGEMATSSKNRWRTFTWIRNNQNHQKSDWSRRSEQNHSVPDCRFTDTHLL